MVFIAYLCSLSHVKELW